LKSIHIHSILLQCINILQRIINPSAGLFGFLLGRFNFFFNLLKDTAQSHSLEPLLANAVGCTFEFLRTPIALNINGSQLDEINIIISKDSELLLLIPGKLVEIL
jgi:hypothetical protein